MIRALGIALMILAVSGCANGKDDPFKRLTKALERRAFDELAVVFSSYCADVYDKGPIIERFRVEMAREIRQSVYGAYGPSAPPFSVASFTPLDKDKNEPYPEYNNRSGRGPVVMIYCQGDHVPAEVWKGLDRYWKSTD